MPVSLTPWCIDGNTHPAADARRAMAGLLGCDLATSFAGGVGAFDPGHGVVRSGDLAVTQNGTPNMSVLVATGSAFIRGTQAASQGVYHAFNDASTNLTIAAANATNPRRDLIVLQIRDAAYSGAIRDARLVVITGTPAASPVDPSLSSTPNALVLARVRVAAAATSITNAVIDDLRTTAGGRGGYTPTIGGGSITGAVTGRYKLSEGWLDLRLAVAFTGGGSGGPWTISLPAGITTHATDFQQIPAMALRGSQYLHGFVEFAPSASVGTFRLGDATVALTTIGGTTPSTWGSGDGIRAQGTIETSL